MSHRRHTDELPDEPVGIVIARGAERETPPRFFAYEWGPAPDAEPEPAAATKAA